MDGLLSKHKFCATNYYKLGLQLGLSASTLDVIGADHKGDSTRCLIECLRRWLKEAENPTLHALIDALKKIGDNAVAKGICNDGKPKL